MISSTPSYPDTHTHNNVVQTKNENNLLNSSMNNLGEKTRLSRGRKDAQISSEIFLLSSLPPNKKKETQVISTLKVVVLSFKIEYLKWLSELSFSSLLLPHSSELSCSLLLLLGSPSLFSLDFSFFSSWRVMAEECSISHGAQLLALIFY